MELTQPYQYLRLIRDAKIKGGKLVGNTYTNKLDVVSLLGEPNLSNLALSVYSIVGNSETFKYDYTKPVTGLIPFFNKLNERIEYRPLFRLFQSVAMESFSLVYALENFNAYRPNFNQEDASRVHNNINLIIDNLYSIDDEYAYTAILALRDIDNDLKYLYSLFSDGVLDYTTPYENNYANINLIPDSEFKYPDQFWLNRNDVAVSTSQLIKSANNGAELITTSYPMGVTLYTTPIKVQPNSRLTLRAYTLNHIDLYAVDNFNNPIRFVDELGTVNNTGLLASTKELLPGTQEAKGVYVPEGVSKVRVEFALYPQDKTHSSSISNLMLVSGYKVGTYVRSPLYDIQ